MLRGYCRPRELDEGLKSSLTGTEPDRCAHISRVHGGADPEDHLELSRHVSDAGGEAPLQRRPTWWIS